MADLFPTPTRLALLRDIADGLVADEPAECLGPDMDCGRPLPCPDHPTADEPEAVIDPGEGLLT